MSIEAVVGLLKLHRRYLLMSALALIIGFTIGFSTSPEIASSYVAEISQRLTPIVEKFKPGTVMGALMIFLNNWVTAVLIFVLNLFSLLIVGFNGWVLGVFASYMSGRGLMLEYILGVIPHGVVELPALIIAGASGLRFGKIIWFRIYCKLRGRKCSVEGGLEDSFKLLSISVILFLIAAFIESFITPYLIDSGRI